MISMYLYTFYKVILLFKVQGIKRLHCVFLASNRIVKSQLVNMREAGVDTVIEIGKTYFNQLHEE